MVTKRALSHLQSLLDLTERADTQIAALASTLRAVNAQIDAVLDDEDLEVSETLTEVATGNEERFILSRSPVITGSVELRVNGNLVDAAAYAVDTAANAIVPLVAIPAGAEIVATYRVAGLRSQIVELMATMPELTAQQFLDRKAAYETAIAWIENR